MTHAIHFLSTALKDVSNSICDSQLAAIEAARSIFSNWRIVEALPPASTTAVAPTKSIAPVPKPAPLRYPAPTYEGDQGRDRVTTSKGDLQQQTPVIYKKSQVAVNCKGDQEPIAARKISRVAPPPNLLPFKAHIRPIDELVETRTISCTVSHNFTTPPRS